MRAALKEWAIRLALVSGSLLFGLVVAEILVRVFFPLYGGRDNVTIDGRRIKSFLEPGIVYRQVSNEYDAVTTITDKGYRAPVVDGNPDVVFVGDSFTFGYGLTDDETFASIYCRQRHLQCANLGMPGSGTSRQVKRLEQFLDRWRWKPKQVKLFFFGMSSSFSAGNDFDDNYNYGRWLTAQRTRDAVPASQGRESANPSPGQATRVGLGERIISWQSAILENVHLMRRVKYHWGPLLKTMVLAEPDQTRIQEALLYTAQALRELDALSRRAGFDYEIYLLVPAHDILMGTNGDSLAMLNGVAPRPAIATAHLFGEARAYYFSYDGHLNPKGSRRLAEFLVSRDGGDRASQLMTRHE